MISEIDFPPIDRDGYLAYARALTDEELCLIREFTSWLPDNIIDCHAHSNLPEHVLEVSERARRHMLSTFPSFSIAESKQWHALLHPGKRIRSLRFAKTFRGIDHRSANLYLLEQSLPEDRVALYGLPDDTAYTIDMLAHPRVSALKMYYSYLEPPATQVYQYFPPEVLVVAEQRGLPIILHPPRNISLCLDQLLLLLSDFPRLKICIAHLGLSKFIVPRLAEAFTTLAAHSQVSFDTALNPSAEVAALALRTIGPDRIMYGSDEPLHLIRSAAYQHPCLGERLAVDYPYHWADLAEQAQFGYLAASATHAHWQSLLALRSAIGTFPKDQQEQIIRMVFHDNAQKFYGF